MALFYSKLKVKMWVVPQREIKLSTRPSSLIITPQDVLAWPQECLALFFLKDVNRVFSFLNSTAPSIYENEDIKKGILCQLFGGANKDFADTGRGKFRFVWSALIVIIIL